MEFTSGLHGLKQIKLLPKLDLFAIVASSYDSAFPNMAYFPSVFFRMFDKGQIL
jgi:hypothetical protein